MLDIAAKPLFNELVPINERETTNEVYYNGLERQVRAAGERVGDPTDLARLLDIANLLERTMARAARRINGDGYSWADIGKGVGVTRQAVHGRWRQ